MRSLSDRITIADVMVMIAATALGLVFVRYENYIGIFDKVAGGLPGQLFVARLMFLCEPPLFAWTLAVLILGLRRRRSVEHPVVRGPGFVACVAVLVAVLDRGAYFAARVAAAAYVVARDPTDVEPALDRMQMRLHVGNSLESLPTCGDYS